MERYDLADDCYGESPCIRQDPCGGYVLYTDAARLESENAALKSRVSELWDRCEKWSAEAGRLQAKVDALRKLCGEAAAVLDNVSPGEDVLIDRLSRAAKGE